MICKFRVINRNKSFLNFFCLLFGILIVNYFFMDNAQAQWVTSGSNIYNSNTGNIGIGTTSPAQKLDVFGQIQLSDSNNSLLRLRRANGGDWGIISGQSFGQTTNNSFILYDVATGRQFFAVNSDLTTTAFLNAYVGIGTTTPKSRLFVSTGEEFVDYATGGNSNGGALRLATNANQAFIGSNQYYDSTGLHYSRAGGAGYIGFDTTAGSTAGDINFQTAPSGAADTGLPLQQVMTIKQNGNVGFGTMTPGSKVEINANGVQGGNAVRFSGLTAAQNTLLQPVKNDGTMGWKLQAAGGNQRDLYITDYLDNPLFTVAESSNVGIGTPSPSVRLHISGAAPMVQAIESTGTSALQLHSAIGSDSFIGYRAGQKLNFGVASVIGGPIASQVTIDNSGNLGIGTTAPTTKLHVVGDVTVTGNIAAKYQDVAEWVPANKRISAGTVVVLDAQKTNQVLPSKKAYDTRVAGVISDTPGLLLGEGGEGKVKVATTGRVKVRVDASKKPIEAGDLLVTSDKEGVAMKSVPLDLGGVPIHRPGTLIGKALEPLKEGEGEILVLLSLQ